LGSINRRITVYISPEHKAIPISKITKAKGAGGVAQVVDCLLWKHEGLSSNPSTN
jgi:hypothetical protein